MDATSLILLGVIVVVFAGVWLRRRQLRQRWPIVSQGVQCPLHGGSADVQVRTNPDAPPALRHVDVVSCSLLSDAAIALPEQRAYLPDTPLCEVVLRTAQTHPVYATGVSCRQACLHVLNAAASARPLQPLACASGVCDGIELMRQADRHATGCQSLWYTSS